MTHRQSVEMYFDSIVPLPNPVGSAVMSIVFIAILWSWKKWWHSDFPVVGSGEEFARDSHAVLSRGMSGVDGPFRVETATGVKIVLPTRYLEHIKNDDRFSFAHEMAKQSLSHLPGFEAFATPLRNNIFQDTIRTKVTQSLGAITESLSEETSLSLKQLIGDDPAWRECSISNTVLNLTTRLSTRVFLGEKFSRNEQWLNLTLNYTMTSMHAAQIVLKWPAYLQRIANTFLPECRQQRAMLQSIQDILGPEITQRKQAREAAQNEKSQIPPGKDTLDWMAEMAGSRPFDLVSGQLQLNFVAIHTTSTLMTDVLLDLCAFPEYIPKLREEVCRVVSENGWKKTAMYKLKRMDSFIKETLRLRPQSMITARRMTTESVCLPDGTKIPKGSSTMVPTITAMVDPVLYPNPQHFDGERFLRMREENENAAQLVTTGANYLGFGIGKDSCPGRFLAANEIKVALCHILLKYDIKLPDGQGRPDPLTWETAYMTNPELRVMIRRRKEEIVLDQSVN